MRRGRQALAVLALLALGGATLTGCLPTNEGHDPTSSSSVLYEYRQPLGDGRTVTCLALRSGYAGGLSCDWDSATR